MLAFSETVLREKIREGVREDAVAAARPVLDADAGDGELRTGARTSIGASAAMHLLEESFLSECGDELQSEDAAGTARSRPDALAAPVSVMLSGVTCTLKHTPMPDLPHPTLLETAVPRHPVAAGHRPVCRRPHRLCGRQRDRDRGRRRRTASACRADAEEGHASARALDRLKAQQDTFFGVIVILQNVSVFLVSTAGTVVSPSTLFGSWGFSVGLVAIPLISTEFGEYSPKVIASRSAERIAYAVAHPDRVARLADAPADQRARGHPEPLLQRRCHQHGHRGRAADADRHRRGRGFRGRR